MRRVRNEQGVVAVVMALVICFVMVPLAALAVDIGMQRVARRDMQSLADVVALDLSRQLTGGTLSSYSQSALQTVANASRDRNATTIGQASDGKKADVSFQLGTTDPTKYGQSDYFTTMTATNGVPTAVRVTANTTVDFGLANALPGGGIGSGGASRSAIANAALQACMMMDSYAAALNTGDSAVLGPLNNLLGTSINTQVLSSSGILTANLDVLSFLGVLQTQLGVGGFDQVLSSHVSAAQILTAEVAALNAQGASAAAQALQSQIGVHIPAGTQIAVSDLIGVTQGGTSGLGATLNPFDLAAAAVQLANGTAPVTLSASGGNLIGLSVAATVGSRPTRVCLGDGKRTMGQTSVQANAKLDTAGTLAGTVTSLVNGLTGLLGNTLCLVSGLLGGSCYGAPTLSDVTLNANLSLAQASGTVTDVKCSDKTYIAALEQSKLAPANIVLSFTVTMKHTFYKGLGIVDHVETLTSTVTTTISTDTPADKATSDKLYVPDDYAKGKAGPSGDLSVTSLNVQTGVTGDIELINKLGGLVNTVNNLLITPLLSTTVTPLLNTLTATLKNLVGLTIAGSNYTPLPTPSCGTPKLIG
jgi:uncharacterized membrane protein